MRYVTALAVAAVALIACDQSAPTAPTPGEARMDAAAEEENQPLTSRSTRGLRPGGTTS